MRMKIQSLLILVCFFAGLSARAANTPPVITSALTATATIGQPFTYTITADGTTPITFTAAPLPAGLSLSGAIISGTPLVAGKTKVTLGASNGTAPADSKVLLITVIRSGNSKVAPGKIAFGDSIKDVLITTNDGSGPYTDQYTITKYTITAQINLVGLQSEFKPDTLFSIDCGFYIFFDLLGDCDPGKFKDGKSALWTELVDVSTGDKPKYKKVGTVSLKYSPKMLTVKIQRQGGGLFSDYESLVVDDYVDQTTPISDTTTGSVSLGDVDADFNDIKFTGPTPKLKVSFKGPNKDEYDLPSAQCKGKATTTVSN